MIERIHLEIVREVARRGTLTAAAEVLCLTQSALSHTMSRLEDRLRTAIWSREGRRLTPTAAGCQLLALAERVLPQLEQAEERLASIAEGHAGLLRIGIECHPCYQWLKPLVRPFIAAWPRVELDIRQRFQFGGIAALLAGEIDVLITPDPIVHAQLEFIDVFDYEHMLVVASAHPLASRRRVLPIDLASEELLTYPVPRERLDIFTHFLQPAGVLPRRHRTVEDTEVLLEWVASGRAVTALPRWLVSGTRQRTELRCLRLGERGIIKQIHLGLRRADRGLAYLEAFVALASSVARTQDRSRLQAKPKQT